MQKSFTTFLQHLEYCHEAYTVSHFLRFLEANHCEELKSLGLLLQKGDFEEILCPSCGEHFTPIHVKDGHLYTICPHEDHERNFLEPEDVQKWTVDFQSLLQQLANKLSLSDQVEPLMVEGLWQVGSFSKDDTHHACYFFCGKNFVKAMEFIRTQPEHFRRYVIITCKQEVTNFNLPHKLLFIELEHLVELQSGNLKFNKKVFEKYLVNGFRSVLLDEQNGDLTVNGQLIVTITPSSPEFHFAQALWGNFNLPQSHRSLVSHIYEKTRQEYADTESKTCHKMKGNIKKDAKNKEMIDQIFKATKNEKGENCYIMREPA